MLNKLKKLVTGVNAKQLSQYIKRDSELLTWVNTHYGSTIAEKVYNAINPNENICVNNNAKKFNSLTKGYRFCGSAATCKCAQKSVSQKVSKSKSAYTEEDKAEIQDKRKQTTLEKYGVNNVGQTQKAKTAHKKFYDDSELVSQVTKHIESVKLDRYGDKNYNNAAQIKETFREKRNKGYWVDKYPDKKIATLENIESLTKLYQEYTPVEIADQLNVHIQTVYRYLNIHGIREPFKSNDENELVRFIESLGITNIVRNTRKLIPSRKEIDIFLPDLNIAIEYNGVYWHHEDVQHITRDYHYNKFKECEDKNIQLITIFSNFWHSKKDIVKKTLAAKLGKSTGSVYARQCEVVNIDTQEAREFLNNNHIQGYTPATTQLGLKHNATLVALMTFSNSKSRLGIGSKSSDTELVRYASSMRVVGGASKLLKHYVTQHPQETIVSYSDNEWSDGKLYKTLGFRLDKEVKHSYWYLHPREHKLYHRFTYAKQKLVKRGYDESKSEAQITKEMGLLKVWDCGKRKWVLDAP